MGTYWVMLIIETGWAFHSSHKFLYDALEERAELKSEGHTVVVIRV